MNINTVVELVETEIGMTYIEYRSLITRLLEEGKVTGHEQTEAYLNYTKLNEVRMNRWDKHFVPSEDMVAAIKSINEKRTWIVITEGWCGDSAQTLPALAKIASANPNIELKFFLRDENEELMNSFLTDGKKSIPVVACLNTSGEVLWQWGSRPQGALDLIADYKNKGVETAVWKEKLHLWYAQNKQQDFQKELISKINSEK